MKLFLIEQDKNHSYDTYDSAVVAAPDERAARYIHPGMSGKWWEDEVLYSWARPTCVKATYLGEAKADTPQGVICASYNAG